MSENNKKKRGRPPVPKDHEPRPYHKDTNLTSRNILESNKKYLDEKYASNILTQKTVRMSPSDKELIEKAAKAVGISANTLIVEAAVARAKSILQADN